MPLDSLLDLVEVLAEVVAVVDVGKHEHLPPPLAPSLSEVKGPSADKGRVLNHAGQLRVHLKRSG